MLGGAVSTKEVVDEVRPYTSETIWIGKMNGTRRKDGTEYRIDLTVPENLTAVEMIEEIQNDKAIVELYRFYQDDNQIRWKDSITKVLKRENIL